MPGHDHVEDDGHDPEAQSSTTDAAYLLDDPGLDESGLDDPAAQNDPAAGMPLSDDVPDAKDADETLEGGAGNDILTGKAAMTWWRAMRAATSWAGGVGRIW